MAMMARILAGLLASALLLLSSLAGSALADSGSDSKTVGNVTIYLGVLPVEMVRGHPSAHPEASMHGGPPTGSGQYHVIVALFDAKTGTRITKADVTARVSEIGLSGEEKKLEPMAIADTETYGNYFRMGGRGPFRIRLAIRVPGQPREIAAEFEHRHQ
jgi:hypothetical protein